jgi:hypothetical protein
MLDISVFTKDNIGWMEYNLIQSFYQITDIFFQSKGVQKCAQEASTKRCNEATPFLLQNLKLLGYFKILKKTRPSSTKLKLCVVK